MTSFSDYIVFADESGDHGLESIDPQFPVFSLIFCLLRKVDYIDVVEPAVRRFKYTHFGHDAVVLHEHHIRKEKPPFAVLRTDPALRAAFHGGLSGLIDAAPMSIYASVIDKLKLKARYVNPYNPYGIALRFLMENLCDRLVREGQRGRRVHVLFESRGASEDKDLELEFRRIVANGGHWGWRQVDFSRCEFEPLFVPKAANMAGHQIADLIARPIALSVLRPKQPNRAMEVIRGKLADCKVFP